MEMKPCGIGLFIIVGFGLTTAILFLIGDQEKAFGKHLTLYTEFNLSGLPNGAKVRVSGLDAGDVKKIEIPKTPSGRFRVELQLQDKVRGTQNPTDFTQLTRSLHIRAKRSSSPPVGLMAHGW